MVAYYLAATKPVLLRPDVNQ